MNVKKVFLSLICILVLNPIQGISADSPVNGQNLDAAAGRIKATEKVIDSVVSPFVEIALTIDLSTKLATAEYQLNARWTANTLALEADLGAINAVTWNGQSIAYLIDNDRLNVKIPVSRSRNDILTIDYQLGSTVVFQGLAPDERSVYTWPYFCSKIFPCISQPEIASRFKMQLNNGPDDLSWVYPARISGPAPAYQLAWAVGDYRYQQLGVTGHGTRVGIWFLTDNKTSALTGAEKLPDVFSWLEQNIGVYSFGSDVAAVEVDWIGAVGGGMEHHPYWHIEAADINNPQTHAHEAVHGWFGNGVRLACWEDFVLSEGTAEYLAAVLLGEMYGAQKEKAAWDQYHSRLVTAVANNDIVARPAGCGSIDILTDLFSDIPYVKGAFFFKELEQEVGRTELISALAKFYKENRGKASGIDELLLVIEQSTGFSTQTLAQQWLYSKGIPAITPF